MHSLLVRFHTTFSCSTFDPCNALADYVVVQQFENRNFKRRIQGNNSKFSDLFLEQFLDLHTYHKTSIKPRGAYLISGLINGR